MTFKGFFFYPENCVISRFFPLFLGTQTNTPDTLRFLIPGMCHLVAEDRPRKIILDMKMHETLHAYLSYHWTIFDSFKSWLQKHVGILKYLRTLVKTFSKHSKIACRKLE